MRPGHVLNNLADVTRGLISAPTEHVDQFFVDGLTNRMFETNTTAMDGLDLVSRKIHGCVADRGSLLDSHRSVQRSVFNWLCGNCVLVWPGLSV